MKKFLFIPVFIFISLFLLFSIPLIANSQSLGVGIKGGPSITSHLKNFRYVSGDINLELTPNISSGFNVGLVYRQRLSKNYRLQLEPSILTMGAKYEEGFELRGFNFQTESETELLYVQLPLLIQLTTSPPERTVYGRQYSNTTYHLTGGVYGSYLLDAQFSGTNTGAPIGINFSGSFSNNVVEQYLDFDAGFMLGVGLENGSSNRFGLDARLMFSVIDSGDASDFSFKPQNMGAIFSLYFLL